MYSSAGVLIGDTENLKLPQIKSNVGYWAQGRTGVSKENEENPLKKEEKVKSREPTNSTHIWHQVLELNPGHIGGRCMLTTAQGMIDFGSVSRFILWLIKPDNNIAITLLLSTLDHLKTAVTFKTKLYTGVSNAINRK